MAMTFTQADLDALKAALLTGALRVRIGDRDVTYRSLEEIERIINRVEASLAGVPTSSSSNIKASFSKGD